jgi:hypothetical protein
MTLESLRRAPLQKNMYSWGILTLLSLSCTLFDAIPSPNQTPGYALQNFDIRAVIHVRLHIINAILHVRSFIVWSFRLSRPFVVYYRGVQIGRVLCPTGSRAD